MLFISLIIERHAYLPAIERIVFMPLFRCADDDAVYRRFLIFDAARLFFCLLLIVARCLMARRCYAPRFMSYTFLSAAAAYLFFSDMACFILIFDDLIHADAAAGCRHYATRRCQRLRPLRMRCLMLIVVAR